MDEVIDAEWVPSGPAPPQVAMPSAAIRIEIPTRLITLDDRGKDYFIRRLTAAGYDPVVVFQNRPCAVAYEQVKRGERSGDSFLEHVASMAILYPSLVARKQ
jgi:hypothetical protein